MNLTKLLSILLMLFMFISQAKAEECSWQQAYDAETNAAALKSWNELREHFLLYGHCDDGAIGEGYSESVSYLMEHQWSEFLSLKMEKSFYNFVQKHVDETWEMSRFKRVTKFAKNNCNDSKRAICQKIISLEQSLE